MSTPRTKRHLRVAFATLCVLVVPIATALAARSHPAARSWTVTKVVDGDTIYVSGGVKVRLLQVDTPETHGTTECYGRSASALTRRLTPVGSRVTLAADPHLDDHDQYGRKLRYVTNAHGKFLQLELVRAGAASPYFYRSARGRYARRLATAAAAARKAKVGAWGVCPRASYDPNRGWSTGPASDQQQPNESPDVGAPATPAPASGQPSAAECAAHHLPCAPNYPPDVNCSDLSGPVWVGTADGSDPSQLDRNGDGIGCNGS